MNTDNMKKRIRLSESDLHRIVEESVKQMVNEIGDTRKGQENLGKLYATADKRAYAGYRSGSGGNDNPDHIRYTRLKNRIGDYAKNARSEYFQDRQKNADEYHTLYELFDYLKREVYNGDWELSEDTRERLCSELDKLHDTMVSAEERDAFRSASDFKKGKRETFTPPYSD